MGFACVRGYQLALTSTDVYLSWSSHFLGFVNDRDRSWAEILKSLEKAERGHYDALYLPLSSAQNPHFYRLLSAAQKKSFQIVIQLSASQLQRGALRDLESLLQWTRSQSLPLLLNYVEDTWEPDNWIRPPDSISFDFATILGTQVTNSVFLAKKLQQALPQLKLYFQFPLNTGNPDLSLSVGAARAEMKNLRSIFGKLLPPPGLDFYDPRGRVHEDFELLDPPEFACFDPEARPRISVVIPTFDQKSYLLNVLQHLEVQDLPKSDFEIVIIDDGSPDSARKDLLEALKAGKLDLNFRYFYFPRKGDREMGDAQFRAGLARNWGAREARGDYLLFLDSDILLPSDYLSGRLARHQKTDVIQGARFELKESASAPSTSYGELCVENDTYTVDRGYWLDFFKEANWQEISGGWRYTCTHSLSLRKEIFFKVGAFRKSFLGYGHEDSELGYKLWNKNYRFALDPKPIFHLYHGDGRSEFANSFERKLELLRKTGRVFYFHTLDEAVLEHCQYISEHEGWGARFLRALCSRYRRRVLRRKDSMEKSYFGILWHFTTEVIKILITLTLTLLAPLEESWQNPRHSRFWHRPKQLVDSLTVATSRLTSRWKHIEPRIQRNRETVKMGLRKSYSALLIFRGYLQIGRSRLLQLAWLLSYPFRKIVYFLRFQLSEFDQHQRVAEREYLFLQARRRGVEVALGKKTDLLGEIEILILSLHFYLSRKLSRGKNHVART